MLVFGLAEGPSQKKAELFYTLNSHILLASPFTDVFQNGIKDFDWLFNSQSKTKMVEAETGRNLAHFDGHFSMRRGGFRGHLEDRRSPIYAPRSDVYRIFGRPLFEDVENAHITFDREQSDQ